MVLILKIKTMKKLLLFIFILTSSTLNGQDFSIGIMGGATSSWEHRTDPRDGITLHNDMHLSPTFGVNAELRLFNDFHGILEANYERKGFEEHYFSTISSVAPTPPESLFRVDKQSSFDYISFPILLRYKYGRKIKAFGSVGVSPSVLIDAEEFYSRYDFLVNNTKRFDIGGIIEAGLEWGISSNISLSSGIRYNKSFTHHNKHPYPENGGELRHVAIAIYGGIKYHIKY